MEFWGIQTSGHHGLGLGAVEVYVYKGLLTFRVSVVRAWGLGLALADTRCTGFTGFEVLGLLVA